METPSAVYVQPQHMRAFLYRTVDSTNRVARSLLAIEPAPFVVVSDSQSAGRGTKGRSFYSPEGSGLYASYCFSLPVERLTGLTPRAAVAASVALERFGKQPAIKWVNDLLLDGKKAGGILTESVIRDRQADVIIGIGINLYPPDEIPQALRPILTSVWSTRAQADPQGLLEELTKQMLYYIENDHDFLETYRRLSCVIGQKIRFLRNGNWHDAKGAGIDPDGHLIVQTVHGTERLHTEEIQILPGEGDTHDLSFNQK